MFGFQQDCMIVILSKENKIVNLLSTLHSEPKVDTSNEQRKPEVILTYNERRQELTQRIKWPEPAVANGKHEGGLL